MGSDAKECAVCEGKNIHGLEAIEDSRSKLRHARRIKVAAVDKLRLAVYLEQVNGFAPSVEAHFPHLLIRWMVGYFMILADLLPRQL